MRLGLFGGTFDPIHIGHIHATLWFKKRLQLNRVLLLPTFAPFYKETCRTPYAHRLAMCRLAVKGMEGIETSDLERNMPQRAFTRDVMREVAARNLGHTLFLLFGSDTFARMPRWKGIDDIIGKAVICVFRRTEAEGCFDGCREAGAELGRRGADIRIFDAPMLPVSSSMIRAKANRGESIRELVSLPVAEYIERCGLTPKTPPMWPARFRRNRQAPLSSRATGRPPIPSVPCRPHIHNGTTSPTGKSLSDAHKE